MITHGQHEPEKGRSQSHRVFTGTGCQSSPALKFTQGPTSQLANSSALNSEFYNFLSTYFIECFH